MIILHQLGKQKCKGAQVDLGRNKLERERQSVNFLGVAVWQSAELQPSIAWDNLRCLLAHYCLALNTLA